MAKSYLQVRTNEEDKEKASMILEQLGTNLSTVVNMLLKQIIITKSIPFETKLKQTYTNEEMINEVKSTMEIENMPLSDSEIQLLRKYQLSTPKEREDIRKSIIMDFVQE